MAELAAASVRTPQGERASMDFPLLMALVLAMLLGLVVLASASGSAGVSHAGNQFYYLIRQCVFLGIGTVGMAVVMLVPVERWKPFCWPMIFAAAVLLAVVLWTPLGKEVNGSRRWIPLGVFNLQPSELAKIMVVFFIANFVSHRQEEVRSTSLPWFIKPLFFVGVIVLFIVLEPDLGSAAVVLGTVIGIMFLAGAPGMKILALLVVAVFCVVALVIMEPYRMARITSFLNPWADQFGSGFQLTQAEIGFGRGSVFGEGLGNSVQKLQFLPEAHTDFIFAVIAEELGLVGALLIVCLMTFISLRALRIGYLADRCGQYFSAYLAYGLALLFASQFLINIGVSSGVLPTKGLALPLFSYGGSNLIITCVAFGLLMRIDFERRALEKASAKQRKRKGGKYV